jgi:hypothetical protein
MDYGTPQNSLISDDYLRGRQAFRFMTGRSGPQKSVGRTSPQSLCISSMTFIRSMAASPI